MILQEKLNGLFIINNIKDFKWLKNLITPDELLKKNRLSKLLNKYSVYLLKFIIPHVFYMN